MKKIHNQILISCTGMLSPYCPTLTPTKLVQALSWVEKGEQEKTVQGKKQDEKKQDEKKLLTIKEVAEILKMTQPTIDKYCRMGMLKKIHVGLQKVYYDAREVNAFAKGHTAK